MVIHSCCYLGQDLTAYIRNGREVAQMCLLKEPFSWWWQKSGKMPDKNLIYFFFSFPFFKIIKRGVGEKLVCINHTYMRKTLFIFSFRYKYWDLQKRQEILTLPSPGSYPSIKSFLWPYNIQSLSLFLNLLYLVQEPKAMFNMFVFNTDNIKVNI